MGLGETCIVASTVGKAFSGKPKSLCDISIVIVAVSCSRLSFKPVCFHRGRSQPEQKWETSSELDRSTSAGPHGAWEYVCGVRKTFMSEQSRALSHFALLRQPPPHPPPPPLLCAAPALLW